MNVIIDHEFREIVEREMAARKWSRSELARQAGMSPQMVTDYLNGRRRPGTDTIEKFLAAFNLRPHLVVEPRV